MSQNTFSPDSWANYTEVSPAPGTLAAPFNADKVAELVNAGMAAIGRSIPPVAYLGTEPLDTTVSIGLPNPVTQADIDAAMAQLVAVCNDPTRNDLTAEQQAELDLAAELAAIQAKIDADTADIALITTASPDALALTGYKAAFASAAYNALSDVDKFRLLRMTVLAILNILLDMLKAQRYVLRTIKKDKTGSITALKV